MKRIIRDRFLTPEEAVQNREIRAQVEQEFPKAKPLSKHQQSVVEHVRQHGGEILRIPGGFWVTKDVILRPGGVPALGQFYTEIRTVRCLERAGYLERINLYTDEWRDTRKLINEQQPV